LTDGWWGVGCVGPLGAVWAALAEVGLCWVHHRGVGEVLRRGGVGLVGG